jgi:hypothetical protein
LVVIICKNSSKSIVPLPSLSISAIIFLISYYQSNSWFWSQENLLGNINILNDQIKLKFILQKHASFLEGPKGHDRKKEIGIKFHILDQLIPCLLLFEFTFKGHAHFIQKPEL